MKNKEEKGFSLVELSIVLVIVGLLIGSVLSGRDLIHASELRSITNEHNKFVTAVGAFRDKYLALPGDMTNATEFWGSTNPVYTNCDFSLKDDGGGPATIPWGSDNSTKTCNGNGDKHVDYSAVYGVGRLGYDEPTDVNINLEASVFWKELGNAGLISGAYNGTYGALANSSDSSSPLAGATDGSTSNPSGKFPQSTWGTMYNGTKGNSMYFMKGPQFNDFSLLTGADVWNIDQKTDDGLPNSGNVQPASTASPAACVNTTQNLYDVTSSVKNCGIEFSNQF